MRKLLLLAGLVAALVAAPQLAGAKHRGAEGRPHAGKAVFVPSNCINSRFQPTTILIACGDGSASLINLTWSSWTATTATGSGNFSYKNCPSSVALVFCSTYDTPPASVTLFRPRFCRKVRKNHFTRVSIDDPAAQEPMVRSFVQTFPCRLVTK